MYRSADHPPFDSTPPGVTMDPVMGGTSMIQNSTLSLVIRSSLSIIDWGTSHTSPNGCVAKFLGDLSDRVRTCANHPSCVFRWVQVYAPELHNRCRPYLRPTNKSYRVDETYVKVKGETKYLRRAVDSTGQTIDFLLTPKRKVAAAKRFFRQVFQTPGNSWPRVINVDKNAAYLVAVRGLKAEDVRQKRTRLRQCCYLNHRVKQDHRFVKQRTRLARGYDSFRTAGKTRQGIEAMHMINKGRVRWLGQKCC